MSKLINRIYSRVGLITSLLVIALVISISVAVASQVNNRSLSGNWNLYIALEGDSSNQSPIAATFVAVGNRVSGKVAVPDVDNTPTGPRLINTSVDMVLTDLRFDGRTLSFRVVNGEDSFTGQLTKVSDDLYQGVWESPIGGRWQGSRNKFTGTLKMVRAK